MIFEKIQFTLLPIYVILIFKVLSLEQIKQIFLEDESPILKWNLVEALY